jgi:asparagine synthase (glutamine-hydrolysing)
MCGIAGKYNFHSQAGESLDKQTRELDAMLNSILHRGPDDSGIWLSDDGKTLLGHRRLSIIDINSRAKQPMASKCKRYICTFNGEIYNYLELRRVLIGKGSNFVTDSDTEVLVEMISTFGIEEALSKIDGMFSIGLWDSVKEELYLIRDRIGKKPLYYLREPGGITFASEIKAIALVNKNLTLNTSSTFEYLFLGYIPGSQTIYKELEEVAPGTYIKFSINGIQKKTFWKPNFNNKIDITYSEALEEVDALLRDAVNKRLRSDVPLGYFLSGGIDSGLIVAMASETQEGNMSTYTVSFEGTEFDESSLANKVADKFNTNHTNIEAEIKPQEDILKVVNQYDEPFGDPSAIPTMAVCSAASRELKVALSGDGGDEVFGGYRRALAAKVSTNLLKFGLNIPSFLEKFIENNFKNSNSYRSKLSFLSRFLRGLNENEVNRYLIWAANGMAHQELDTVKISSSNKASLFNSFPDLRGLDVYQQISSIDFSSQLPDSLLVKMDIASMAYGLEVRSPFLDQALVEFSLSLPMEIKMNRNKTKPLLRDLASRYLPSEIFNAPKKGFEIPLVNWLQDDLSELVNDTFSNRNSSIYDFLDRNFIESLPNNSQNLNLHQWSNQLWIILMFRLWEEKVK